MSLCTNLCIKDVIYRVEIFISGDEAYSINLEIGLLSLVVVLTKLTLTELGELDTLKRFYSLLILFTTQ